MSENKSKIAVSVFIDLHPAFETFDRLRLVKKLQLYGVKNQALHWLNCYLNNRFQRKRINDNLSNVISSKNRCSAR